MVTPRLPGKGARGVWGPIVSTSRRGPELARADRVLPGLWRLRLPLPWSAVPHVNAWAVASDSGVVLVDCGLQQPDGLEQLSRALGGADMRLEDVRLLVCTHAHPDHFGQAAAIVDAVGCELWMHPAHAHATEALAHPEAALAGRLEMLRTSGVPESTVAEYAASRRDEPPSAEVVLPDRGLVAGMTVETDLGGFEVHEAPGHAPSHVVLHQAAERLLLSGDHLLGRISLFYDVGYTPDPVAEFLDSLDRVEGLDARLCLAGHARPFFDVRAHVKGTRRRVHEQLDIVRRALSSGPRTPFEVAAPLLGAGEGEELPPLVLNWGLALARAYLGHLEAREEVTPLEGEGPARWALGGA
jgi:glyoxylase-like metal-dependent hydrolase (beta-lactamase superfamily II)